MELLCAADLHLGRQPSRVPARLRGSLMELGPAAAWRRLVDTAVERGVTAVLLAGDVVDDDSDFYEAFADLRAGVERLLAAGVQVVAVAGNHDVTALPRLAKLLPGFKLLGAAGAWESARISAGGVSVNVVGWSFPAALVHTSPLASLNLAALDLGTGLTIGLLHADLDQSGSYAPVTTAELDSHPVAAWLLGHVHKPHRLGERAAGYLGSLSAADPGEEGPRGAWLVRVGAGVLELEHLCLTPLRYERVVVDVGGLERIEDLDELLLGAMDLAVQGCLADGSGLRALGLRVELRGRSELAAEVARHLAESDLRAASYDFSGVACFVHDVAVLVEHALDLLALAGGSDPLALAARTVLELRDAGSDERGRLLAGAAAWADEVGSHAVYRQLEPLAPSQELLVDLLEEAALRAIDLMLENRAQLADGGVT